MSMRRVAVVLALLLLTTAAFAQSSALRDITFTWGSPQQTQSGFGKQPAPEIDRYTTLQVNVPASFANGAAKQLGGPTTTALVDELNAFTQLAAGLKAYTTAITVAAGASPGTDISLDPAVVASRRTLADALGTFIRTVKPIDRPLYDTVSNAFLHGYPAVAEALGRAIDQLNTRLAAEPKDGALGMTATIVPVESDARALHLPGYDTITQASVAAVPNYIPVVDDRTRAEVTAAQTLIDTTKQLGQVGPELQKSIDQLKTTLDTLKTTLKTDVLEKQLTQLETDIRAAATADLGDLLKEVEAARTLVHTINAADLTLTGTTDADKLLNLASSMSDTANGLIAAADNLPGDLKKLATDVEAAVKKNAKIAATDTVTAIKSAAEAFAKQQTFFISLANNLKTLSSQFSANSDAALSAERLETTARALGTTTDLNTSLNLAMIAGDVHVQDQIVLQAGLYRRNADGTYTSVDKGQQSFIVQRYGVFPDSVRGGLIFAQPRSKVSRDISYQPVPALGYYWRYGIQNHPAWNSASPSLGFTMALLDFSDKNDLEIGFAAGVSLFRNLLWTGYGRNLQARANYFYVGLNPLLLGKMIINRRSTP